MTYITYVASSEAKIGLYLIGLKQMRVRFCTGILGFYKCMESLVDTENQLCHD